MTRELTSYEPRDLRELESFAGRICNSGLVPQAYRGKPNDAIVAAMYGKECAGLGPMISLQSIAVINGKPAFYGDALPGIAFNKGMIVDMEEFSEGKPYDENFTAVCIVTRPNGRKVTQRFSVADARKAGLWGKSGPWSNFPQRMLQWRARSWAIRDAAPHLLFGPTVEELTDQPNIGADRARDITPSVAIIDPADRVEVCDQYGQVEFLDPLEVGAWAAERATESSEDELDELFALNAGNAAIRDAITAERKARAERAKHEFTDQPPADTAAAADIQPDLKKGRALYKQAKASMADGDFAAAVKAKLEAWPHLDDAGKAAFDALLNVDAEAA